jgi:hypothetical protein
MTTLFLPSSIFTTEPLWAEMDSPGPEVWARVQGKRVPPAA